MGSKASNLQHTMQATMKATLGGGELQNTVKLPEGEDLNEWIAVNTVHFFNVRTSHIAQSITVALRVRACSAVRSALIRCSFECALSCFFVCRPPR